MAKTGCRVRQLLSLSLIAIGMGAHAQSVSVLMGARNAGIGYASSTLASEWSIFNNVGALADHRDISAAVSYEIGPALPGGNRMAAVSSGPIGKGVVGAGVFRFGDEVYNETVITAGYSHRLGLAALGLGISYIQYRAVGIGVTSQAGITLGGRVQLTPKFLIGAYATNINRPIISERREERLPTALVIGMQLAPTEKLLLALELEKDLEYDILVKGGVAYKVFKKIELQVGFNLGPDALFAGIGYQLWRLGIGYALQYNIGLMARHQASVSFRIKEAKKDS